MCKSRRNDFMQLEFLFEEVKSEFISYWGGFLPYLEVHIPCQSSKYQPVTDILYQPNSEFTEILAISDSFPV